MHVHHIAARCAHAGAPARKGSEWSQCVAAALGHCCLLLLPSLLLQISDFGLARVKTQAAINTRAPEVGSIGYMAPGGVGGAAGTESLALLVCTDCGERTKAWRKVQRRQ